MSIVARIESNSVIMQCISCSCVVVVCMHLCLWSLYLLGWYYGCAKLTVSSFCVFTEPV